MIRLRIDGFQCVVESGKVGEIKALCGRMETIIGLDHEVPVAIVEASPVERELLRRWGFGHLAETIQVDRYLSDHLRAMRKKGGKGGLKNPRKKNAGSLTSERMKEYWRLKKAGKLPKKVTEETLTMDGDGNWQTVKERT